MEALLRGELAHNIPAFFVATGVDIVSPVNRRED